jgi:hypothetical protein
VEVIMGDSVLNTALLLGSTVKWLWMPLLETAVPAVEKFEVRKKRAVVLVLSLLLSPIYCGGIGWQCLYVALNGALIAIGQHHLFKQEK